MAMLLSATLAAFYFRLPNWLGVVFSLSAGLATKAYLGSYFYLMFTDRDALRSERYSIQKLAIEKGLYGDNLTGTFRHVDEIDPLSLGPQQSSLDQEPKV
ncbi:MAG: hypothetical protein OXI64_05455 [Defluviicoccus sp.]|nr:hypothetical protein [Defluviicoccus sp.]